MTRRSCLLPSGRTMPRRWRDSCMCSVIAYAPTWSPRRGAALLALHRGHIPGCHLERLSVLTLWAEFDQLSRFLGQRRVARRQVVDIAGRQHFFPIGVAHPQPAADDVAPMRALAAIVW